MERIRRPHLSQILLGFIGRIALPDFLKVLYEHVAYSRSTVFYHPKHMFMATTAVCSQHLRVPFGTLVLNKFYEFKLFFVRLKNLEFYVFFTAICERS